MRKAQILLFCFSVLALFGSCRDSDDQGDHDGKISIDGSSTVFPITEAIAEEFRTEQPKTRITIGISGTGGGFQKFARGETAISNASRPIKQKEIEDCAANNVEYLELTVAFDGLAVVINPQNTWAKQLTIAELRMIWEPAAQGNITHWNQIRPEWPNEELHLYGPGIASGTYDYFTEAVVGKIGSSRGDFTASEDDNVLVQGISHDKFGLGFFGFAFFEENRNKLALVAVDGGKGPVYPSVETVKDGSYAPLSRPLLIYINSKAVHREEVISFVHFYLKNVARMCSEVGYIPMPSAQYEVELKKFDDFVSQLKSGK